MLDWILEALASLWSQIVDWLSSIFGPIWDRLIDAMPQGLSDQLDGAIEQAMPILVQLNAWFPLSETFAIVNTLWLAMWAVTIAKWVRELLRG